MLMTAVVIIVAAVAAIRVRTRTRALRTVAARLSLGPDGVIVGAAPIDLPAATGRAALLLHGFGDTPQTLRYLASYLQTHGWAVRAPLLPGHGRSLDEFSASRVEDWVGCARQELDELRGRYSTVSLVGLSMGGSLATILAAESPDVRAVVLLAPYLSMPTRLRRAAAAHRLVGVVTPFLGGGGDRSIRDPDEVAQNLAYRYTTPRLVYELSKVVARARRAAPTVTAPTLVIQSRQDNRIPPDAAERAFALFTAPERRLIWTEGNGHVITVDYGRQAVFASVVEWLAAHTDVATPSQSEGHARTTTPSTS